MVAVTDKWRVAILADERNEGVPQDLRRQLKSAPLPEGLTHRDIIVNDHIDANSTTAKIADRLRQSQSDVVIAVLGVSELPTYDAKIDALLDAWYAVEKKPVLLLSSLDPHKTKQAVDRWFEARPALAPLREAVHVNEFFILSGGSDKIMAEVEKCKAIAVRKNSELFSAEFIASEKTVSFADRAGQKNTSIYLGRSNT